MWVDDIDSDRGETDHEEVLGSSQKHVTAFAWWHMNHFLSSRRVYDSAEQSQQTSAKPIGVHMVCEDMAVKDSDDRRVATGSDCLWRATGEWL